MSPNRIVALLTPLVFAPLAGGVASWLAQHFPGVDVKQSDLQSVFIAGALIALAPAAQWLHGWQKHEARQAEAEQAVELATLPSAAAPAAAVATVETVPDLGDLEEPDDLSELDDLGDLTGLDDLDEASLPPDDERQTPAAS